MGEAIIETISSSPLLSCRIKLLLLFYFLFFYMSVILEIDRLQNSTKKTY